MTREYLAYGLAALLSFGGVMAAPAGAQTEHAHHEVAADAPACEAVARRGSAACTVEEYLLTLLDRGGVEVAMAALDSMAATDADIKRDAHGYAHAIGMTAFTTAEEVGDVFARCTPEHQSGCYHGVIQAYFTEYVSGQAGHFDGALINALCEAQRDDPGARWLLFQCAHGMGHGLAMVSDHHLPTALEGCDLVSDPWERDSCYGGVFMENIVHTTVPHHTPGAGVARGSAASAGHDAHDPAMAAAPARTDFPPLRKAEPFYPCSVIDERYLAACYQMQTSAILYFNGQNVAATARICATAPEVFRSTCFQSLGRDVSAITLQNHSQAIRLCGSAPTDFQPWCHIGYAKNLIDVTANASDGFTYCRLLPVGESKRACNVAVGEQIWVLADVEEQRATMCREAEPEYVAACRYGAGLSVDGPVSWVPRARGAVLRAG